MQTNVVEKFLRYVKVDTQSSEESGLSPSTEKQKNLGRMLYEELKQMGAEAPYFDEEHCYVYGFIPATDGGAQDKVMGLIAHMDTSPETSGTDVKPRIVSDYDGKDIILNEREGYVLSPKQYPELLNYVGKSLIVTDGTTLLGADDKAGVAEIMAAAEYWLTHPEIPHGRIAICFTPDEEIGSGVDHMDLERFGADYAYTVDGGGLGELEYENFNAASAILTVRGKSVHPGDAKHKMRNALLLAYEFHTLLPVMENPMYTEGYEGFYHPDHIEGSVEQAVMHYIIRDHDRQKFKAKKERFQKTAAFLNEKYGESLFSVEVHDSYYNMKEQILPHMHLIEHATRAMEELSITPCIRPIRGGTDGARLSFMGLPCPNLGTGGHNFHGRYEYICMQSMEKTVELLLKIVARYAASGK